MHKSNNYKGFYINLSKCIDRRIFIEHQLREIGVLDNYQRFEALTCNKVPKNSRLTKSEIACLNSHMQLLYSCKDSNKHIHIIEDDVKFSPLHHQEIEKFFSINDDWDILFTGLQIPIMKSQINALINIHEQQNKDNQINMAFFDMQNFLFVGAYSYIVNKKSISKILDIYDKQTNNEPIDFIFRKEIYINKSINARCVLPMMVAHSGEMQTTMKDRAFELTYKYQYLFQKPLLETTNLEDVYNDIQEYALSINYEVKNKSKDLRSIYEELISLGDYINSESNIHGKYRHSDS